MAFLCTSVPLFNICLNRRQLDSPSCFTLSLLQYVALVEVYEDLASLMAFEGLGDPQGSLATLGWRTGGLDLLTAGTLVQIPTASRFLGDVQDARV